MLKLRGYQRFSKEQEILEKVSTNFISVDRDNVRTKVDEMFVMTAEILNFDSAYLFELDENYENAKILNVYMADERESSPFERGTTFKTANFPEVKPLVSQNTLSCAKMLPPFLLLKLVIKEIFSSKEELTLLCTTNSN